MHQLLQRVEAAVSDADSPTDDKRLVQRSELVERIARVERRVDHLRRKTRFTIIANSVGRTLPFEPQMASLQQLQRKTAALHALIVTSTGVVENGANESRPTAPSATGGVTHRKAESRQRRVGRGLSRATDESTQKWEHATSTTVGEQQSAERASLAYSSTRPALDSARWQRQSSGNNMHAAIGSMLSESDSVDVTSVGNVGRFSVAALLFYQLWRKNNVKVWFLPRARPIILQHPHVVIRQGSQLTALTTRDAETGSLTQQIGRRAFGGLLEHLSAFDAMRVNTVIREVGERSMFVIYLK